MIDVEKRRVRNRRNGAKKYAERRILIDAIKMKAGCIDCGFNSHPAALAFDHLDPSKKSFKIGSGFITRNWEKVLAEIAKCVVRCCNCHAIKTVASGDMLVKK